MPTDKKPSTHAWLCLRFTQLSLNSLGYELNSDISIAITYQQQIWQCSLLALESGIAKGMSVNHALMLNPDLKLHERDLQLETTKRQELSYWAYRYTSLVSPKKEDILLLEIEKSFKLFNGLENITHLIKKDLADFKIDASLGLAKTPKAAIVLSFLNHQELNSSDIALGQAKLKHLEQPPKIIQKLLHCGFLTLSDISNIPHSELGSRFGQDFLIYLRQLSGDLADPQVGITPPETFSARVEFAEPISNIIWIQQQLDQLLDDLIVFVNSRQLLCRGFTWHFYHENNRLLKTVHISVNAKQNLNSALNLNSASKQSSAFKELTALKLENMKFDWEFSSITLSSTHLIPKQLFNDDLFNPAPSQEQFQQLLDKLTSRLGHSAVFQLRAEAEHLPEFANTRVSTNSPQVHETPISYKTNKAPKQASENEWPSHAERLKDEPLCLLDTPRRLLKHGHLPLLDGPLNIIHGPNRITSHWWSALQSRDYFIARQSNGRLLWVFFDRVERNWFLHGLYA